jgi:N-acetylneuraminic acid mutarotase
MKKHLVNLIIVICVIAIPEIINAQAIWTKKADLPGVEREDAVGFSIGTKGYVGTGTLNGGGKLKDFWEWDQGTDTWTQKADFAGTHRKASSAFSIGTKGYIGAGNDSFGYTNDFWEWDQNTNIWTQKASIPGQGRCAGVGFSIGTKGYIGLGYGWITTYLNDLWEWDQATNTWTQKASFTGTGRAYPTGASIGTKAYVGLGTYSGMCYNDLWEWDQSTNSWTQKADFPGTKRYGAVAFTIGAKCFVGTGHDTTVAATNDFWQWDQLTNNWLQIASIIAGKQGTQQAVGFSIGNKGYISTGDSCGLKKDLQEYGDTSSVTGINEISKQISISVFPNPFSFSSTLTISENVSLTNLTLYVFNIDGRMMCKLPVISYESVIERKGLAPGIYFYKLTDGRKVNSIGKLLVQ